MAELGSHNAKPERRAPVRADDLYSGFLWPWVRLTGDAYRILGSTEVRFRDALLPTENRPGRLDQ